MTDTPKRIWIDEHGGNWSPVSGGTQSHEYHRADLSDAQAARIAELGSLIHKRGNDIAVLKSDLKKAEARAEAAEAKLRIYEGCNGKHVSSTGMIDEMAGALKRSDKRIAELEAERDAAQQLLRRWQETGCPDCMGDCASANPPVISCIMRETSGVLK